jgi:hypothetical protein
LTNPPKPAPPILELEPGGAPNHRIGGWAERGLWTLVGAAILNWSVNLLGPASSSWLLAVLLVVAGFWGLCVTFGTWLPLAEGGFVSRHSNLLAWCSAFLLIVLLGAWAIIQVHNQPNYTTDELSFDQYAALLVRHGFHNPYTHSMGPAVPLFRLAPNLYTYTLNGTPVEQLSYPSLSFLMYLPFMLLGWENHVGDGVNVIAWAAAIMLMFKLLPRELRAVALLIGSIDVYTSFAAGGVTDMLFIPLLIVAAYRWDRFGETRLSYIGPVALGLAMAVKQTPWPILVFVLLAIVHDEFDRTGLERALRRGGRYLTAVVIAFLIPNLGYIIASPSAWFNGVMTPFVKNTVPSGQGLVALTLFAHLGGGSLTAFTIATVLVLILLVVAFVGTYPLLRPATFLLPVFAYFVAARSQTNYFIAFIPVALVGAATARPTVMPVRRVIDRKPWRWLPVRSMRWGGALSLALVLSVAAIVYSLTASPPFSIAITRITTDGYLSSIYRLALRVTNHSGKPLAPAFTVQTSGGDTTFWDVLQGPDKLAPHTAARYVIRSPNHPSDPGLSDEFSVLAFTDAPASVSVSHRYATNLWRTGFVPQAINTAIPVGRTVTVEVQVTNHFNIPVRKAGIPVYLGQLIYSGRGGHTASARINGNPAGVGQIVSRTDADGAAIFHIVGTKPTPVPISFTAHLVNRSAGYVYATSGYLDIGFKQ